MEQIGLQLESTSRLISILAIFSDPDTSGLQLVISSRSPTLVVHLDSMITSPTSLVASTLVYMKTFLRLPSISSVPLMVGPVTPSMIVTTKLPETSPSKPTRSSGVIDVEKEFVAEMIDTFYKSLKRCISLVLKGSTSPFEFLKVILTQNIKTIRNLG